MACTRQDLRASCTGLFFFPVIGPEDPPLSAPFRIALCCLPRPPPPCLCWRCPRFPRLVTQRTPPRFWSLAATLSERPGSPLSSGPPLLSFPSNSPPPLFCCHRQNPFSSARRGEPKIKPGNPLGPRGARGIFFFFFFFPFRPFFLALSFIQNLYPARGSFPDSPGTLVLSLGSGRLSKQTFFVINQVTFGLDTSYLPCSSCRPGLGLSRTFLF